MENLRFERHREIPIHDDTHRVDHPLCAGSELRIVRKDRPCTDHDALVAAAQDMYFFPRVFTGNPLGVPRVASRLAIQRHRSLVEDEGLVLRDIFQEDFIQLLRFLFHDTDRHENPRFFQLADPLAGDERIRILHRDDHAVDTFFHHEVSARRRLPIVRTWLERHIERRPLRIFCRVSETVHFRMRPAIYFMPALADDAAIFHKHRPDHRIRTGMSHAAHR